MSKEEFKFSNKSILLEKREELGNSYKIKSYNKKLKLMEEKNIPQKEINQVIDHLFNHNTLISKKTKSNISKIIYSENDRIIVTITKFGKEFIWNRDKFIRTYGWFFFVSDNEDDKTTNKKKKKYQNQPKKEEKTINIEDFQYENHIIPLKQKENMRGLYNTKEYFRYFKILKSENIPQLSIKKVLSDFFFKNKLIPLKEKKSIKKIIYYQKEKVIVIKSLIGDEMYDNLKKLVKQYGWYFYITGVPVGASDISIAIDKIEKRFNLDYFKALSLSDENESKKINMTLYPLVLKPNHNCVILGIGKLNFLLDCGITEEYFEYIKDYLKNLPELLIGKENETIELKESNKFLKSEESELEKLKAIDDLREFGTKSKILEDKLDIQAINEESKKISLISSSFKPKIDGIFISHSHFDHVSGLKDLIKLYPDVPILCSRITLDLYMLRDSDFLKQEIYEEIEEEEYRNVIKNVIYVENGDKIEFKDKDCYLSFFHAGHMPGALMLLAKVNNFNFLYTGDYTYWDITPFAGTRRFLEQISHPIDFLLIDASCAHEDFGAPSQQLHSLTLFLEQKAEYGDNTLIGADPSSLALTFMLNFWRYFRKLQLRKDFQKRPNIYVDMMIRKNIQVINHRYEYIYGPISRLIRDKANPFNSIKFRWFDRGDLDFLRKKNNIIISHPPDLSYGIIRPIINIVGRNMHNLVFLSGAIHEQPGLDLIEGAEEISFSEMWKIPFRALLLNKFAPQIKIKLHGDKSQLTEMIKNLEPKEVCFFHQSIKKLLGFKVAEHVKSLGVEKVSVPIKRTLMILN
ncbi:MAG: MBL fold metallo-hydrolase [Promethearchaeota archaeon]